MGGGVGGTGACIEEGGGEGICSESQGGIYTIVQYYPAHVTKRQREWLVRRGTDERGGKRKQGDERGVKSTKWQKGEDK